MLRDINYSFFNWDEKLSAWISCLFYKCILANRPTANFSSEFVSWQILSKGESKISLFFCLFLIPPVYFLILLLTFCKCIVLEWLFFLLFKEFLKYSKLLNISIIVLNTNNLLKYDYTFAWSFVISKLYSSGHFHFWAYIFVGLFIKFRDCGLMWELMLFSLKKRIFKTKFCHFVFQHKYFHLFFKN